MINAFRRFDTEHGAEQSPVGQYSWWSLQMLRGFLQICVSNLGTKIHRGAFLLTMKIKLK